MSKQEYQDYKKPYLLLPLSIACILIIGIVISVIQLRQQQSTKSKASSPVQNCTVTPAQLTISTEEQKLFDDINQYRQQHNLQPLTWSPVLTQAATWLSNDMLAHNALSHTDSLGRNAATRLTQCGNQETNLIGENIDSGNSDPSALLASWEHAPAQNANLLNASFTEIGISLATGSAQTQAAWTINLAGPAPTATTVPSPTTNLTPIASASPTVKPSTSVTITLTPTISLSKTPTPSPSKAPTPTVKVSPTIAMTSTPTPTENLTPVATRVPTKPFTPTKVPAPTNEPSPTIDPSFIANPNDMQIFVSIKLPGIGNDGNKLPKNLSRKVQVDIYDMQNKVVTSGYGFLRYDKKDLYRGIVHFGKVPDGTYYTKILSQFKLNAVVLPEFQTLSSSRLNILPKVTLAQGDFDADNAISIADYNLALECFQNGKCETKDQLDFNDDGTTNVSDYNLLLQNYWRTFGD